MARTEFDDFAIIPIDIGAFNTFVFDMGDEEGGRTEGHEISSYTSSALWREGWDDDLDIPRPPKDTQFIAEGEAALFKILERGVRHFASVGAVIVPLGQETADDGNIVPFMGLVVHKADADIALSLVHDRDEITGKHGGRIRIPPLGRFKGLVMAVYADWRQEPWPRSPIDMFAAARAAAAEDFVSPQMSLASVGSDRLPFANEEMTDWLARVCVPSDQLAALAKWWETCGKNFELFASHSMVIRRRSSQPIEWVVPGLVQRGEVTSLVGPSEAGKSTALADLVSKLSDREDHEAEFLGTPVQSVDGLCVYITAEDNQAVMDLRIAQCQVTNSEQDTVIIDGCGKSIEEILSAIDGLEKIDLVIVDAVAQFADDENDAGKSGPFYDHTIAFARRKNCGMIVVHHFSKTKRRQAIKLSEARNYTRGSGVHIDRPRLVIAMLPRDENHVEVGIIKSNLPPGHPVWGKTNVGRMFRKTNGGLIAVEEKTPGRAASQIDANELVDWVCAELAKHSDAAKMVRRTGQKSLYRLWRGGAVPFPRTAIENCVSDLVSSGRVLDDLDLGLILSSGEAK